MSISREFYALPGRHTDLKGHTIDIDSVERAIAVVQGLLIYDTVASDLYNVELSARQAASVQEREAGALLDLALQVDARPLGESRPPSQRIGGRCNTYTLLTVALLRSAQIPARARCGFATYFAPGAYEDHWIVEYWIEAEQRWGLVDAQLDEVWRQVTDRAEPDAMVVNASEFVTAGHAWQAWRRGELDADRCGLTSISQHGSFWIAANLRLDFAALNKIEMLPWDVWGLGWSPGEEPDDMLLAAFDAVAALTVDPDGRFDELRSGYESDDGLRMDGTVINALTDEVQNL